MPFDLFLARHGVTDWNEAGRLLGRTDVPLNARGRAEAEAVAQALQDFPLRAVAASPQRRAQETAEAVARPHGLAVGAELGLAEVWVKESWQGQTWSELHHETDIQRYLQDPLYRCQVIEPASAVQERVVATADRLRRGTEGPVLLISHGDPIKLLLAHYLSMDLPAYHRLVINTGSVSVVRFNEDSGARLLVLNWKPPGTLRQLLD